MVAREEVAGLVQGGVAKDQAARKVSPRELAAAAAAAAATAAAAAAAAGLALPLASAAAAAAPPPSRLP